MSLFILLFVEVYFLHGHLFLILYISRQRYEIDVMDNTSGCFWEHIISIFKARKEQKEKKV